MSTNKFCQQCSVLLGVVHFIFCSFLSYCRAGGGVAGWAHAKQVSLNYTSPQGHAIPSGRGDFTFTASSLCSPVAPPPIGAGCVVASRAEHRLPVPPSLGPSPPPPSSHTHKGRLRNRIFHVFAVRRELRGPASETGARRTQRTTQTPTINHKRQLLTVLGVGEGGWTGAATCVWVWASG